MGKQKEEGRMGEEVGRWGEAGKDQILGWTNSVGNQPQNNDSNT